MAQAKRTGHYVASTHWDREWYQSFQHYRARLVKLIDEIIATMKDDDAFPYFQMDGQSIPVEDYLEIRPECEEEIRALTEEGRLRLGPWYVLPDEFLVSGESIIRNLQMGLTVASHYGRPSRVGFCCDMFGHISQLPQIFRGFSIDNALVWRGINESRCGAMFRWASPDGSEVMAYRFSPKSGYCAYAFAARAGHQPDEPVTLKNVLEKVEDYLAFEMKRCPTPSFLIFDGGDHMEIEPLTPKILAALQKKHPEIEIVHSHLDGFIEDLREQRDQVTQTVTGELRDPAEMGDEQWLIPGVASSRVPLKQANARCESLLTQWAEPFAAFAALHGMAYPKGFLNVAWKHLLQNHPHDSICGCSIDQVHKDMEYRFAQCEALGTQVLGDALEHIVGRIALPPIDGQEFAVTVFNPTADAIDGPVDLTLRFPEGIDATFQEFFGFEPKVAFDLLDADGKALPYQYVAQRRDVIGFRRRLRKFPAPDRRHEVDVTAPLEVPAYGYSTLLVRPVKGRPTRFMGSMLVDDHTIENERLRVSVATNGTVSLTDKRGKQTYEGLLTLEDCADIGDGWYHGPAVNDQVYTSTAAQAEVAVIADGPHKATLMVRLTLNLPEQFCFHQMRRSDRRAPLVVTHELTLRQGSDRLEVRTVVENSIRDHRLRVLLPTGATAEACFADQAFDVVERPIALRADNAALKELEVEGRPQQSWTAVLDGQRGLAVVCDGLRECAVRDLAERPIALTLLRSFIKAVLTSGNEGGQIQGRHGFRYEVVPVSGALDGARLTRLGQQLAAGIRAVQTELRDLPDRPAVAAGAALPLSHSFLQVGSDRVVVTAVHRHGADKATTVRLFNPTGKPVDGTIALGAAGGHATLTDLEGRPGDSLPATSEGVKLSVKPKQIVTVRIG